MKTYRKKLTCIGSTKKNFIFDCLQQMSINCLPNLCKTQFKTEKHEKQKAFQQKNKFCFLVWQQLLKKVQENLPKPKRFLRVLFCDWTKPCCCQKVPQKKLIEKLVSFKKWVFKGLLANYHHFCKIMCCKWKQGFSHMYPPWYYLTQKDLPVLGLLLAVDILLNYHPLGHV